jgi:hypothetical protein
MGMVRNLSITGATLEVSSQRQHPNEIHIRPAGAMD